MAADRVQFALENVDLIRKPMRFRRASIKNRAHSALNRRCSKTFLTAGTCNLAGDQGSSRRIARRHIKSALASLGPSEVLALIPPHTAQRPTMPEWRACLPATGDPRSPRPGIAKMLPGFDENRCVHHFSGQIQGHRDGRYASCVSPSMVASDGF